MVTWYGFAKWADRIIKSQEDHPGQTCDEAHPEEGHKEWTKGELKKKKKTGG